jgi:very-short-patch-repair endonuclease
MDWSMAPSSGIVRLIDVDPTSLATALDDLPDDGAAVLILRLSTAVGASEIVDDVLANLESTAHTLYPAWLPDAEVSPGRGTLDRVAAQALAVELAGASKHYRPYLVDLTTNAIAHRTGGRLADLAGRYSAAVRMSGVVRVLADSFARDRVVLALYAAEELASEQQECLASACDWLSTYVGVWLLDRTMPTVDRYPAISVTSAPPAIDADEGFPWVLPAVTYPAVSGRPHPGSDAELRLETHLAQQQWAHRRRWNQSVETGTLEPYVRADLVWHDATLVVEIDGPDHRTKTKYSDDRRRDIALQLAGYTVLRFTNDQVLSDTTWVAAIIEKLHNRRLAAKELP